MKILTKSAKLWVILILLALFLLANFVVVPAIYPKFQTLDTLSSYTPEQAYQLITSAGPAGRSEYVLIECTLDIIYPFISALLFSLLILSSIRQGFPKHPGWQKLALLPFAVMLADLAENICVAILLLSFPTKLNWLAGIANIFTISKLVFTPFELIFIIGFAAWVIRALLSLRPSRAIQPK